jgi:hypothetical protein
MATEFKSCDTGNLNMPKRRHTGPPSSEKVNVVDLIRKDKFLC